MKKPGAEWVPPSLPEALRILRDPDQMIDWDDAWDRLAHLGPADKDGLPLLFETIRDPDAESGAKAFGAEALLRIAPNSPNIVRPIAELTIDRDEFTKGIAVRALAQCGRLDVNVAVSALAHVVGRGNAYVGTRISAFSALVKLVGFRKACRAIAMRK
jgi:hypothetical protein